MADRYTPPSDPRKIWNESEASLIEAGIYSYDDLVASHKAVNADVRLIEAKETEADLWDRIHCPVCGADWQTEPEHCKKSTFDSLRIKPKERTP